MWLRRLTWCVKNVYNMKRNDLIKKLVKAGFRFKRDGGKHDIFTRGSEREEIPRHREINEYLAKAILKRRGLL